MANTISSLQMYAPKSWSGLTTENHLGSVFAQEPTLVSNIISRVSNIAIPKPPNLHAERR